MEKQIIGIVGRPIEDNDRTIPLEPALETFSCDVLLLTRAQGKVCSADCVVMFNTVVDIYYLLLIAQYLLLVCMKYYSFVRLLKCLILLLGH